VCVVIMAYVKRYPLAFLKHKKLVYAVINGDVEYVRTIVPDAVAVNQSIIPYPGGQSTYMAFIAVEHDKPEVLEYLLQNGADSSLKDHRGMNLFGKVAALPHSSKEITDMLFTTENAPLSSLLNDQTAAGNTTVHLAVSTDNLYTLDAMLKMTRDLMVATVRNVRRDTPLILAVKNRNVTMASMLLSYAYRESNEPLSTTDKDGYTAVELAKMYGLEGLVQMMLSGGRKCAEIRGPRPPNPPPQYGDDDDDDDEDDEEDDEHRESSFSKRTSSLLEYSFGGGSEQEMEEEDDTIGLGYTQGVASASASASASSSSNPLIDEIINLKAENDRLREAAQSMFDDPSCENAVISSAQRSAEHRMATLRDELEAIIESRDAKIVALNVTLAEVGDYATADRGNSEDWDRSRLVADLDNTAALLRAAEVDLDSMREKQTATENALGVTRLELSDVTSRAADLYSNTQELISIVNEAEVKNDEVSREVADLRADNIYAETRLLEQTDLTEGLRTDVVRLSLEGRSGNERMIDLTAEVERMTAEKAFMEENLSEKKRERKRKMGLLAADLKSTHSRVAAQSSEADKRTREIKVLKETIASLKDGIEVIKSNALDTRAELEASRASLKTTVSKLAKTEKSMVVANKELTAVKLSSKERDEKSSKRKQETAALSSEVKHSNSELGRLNKLLGESEINKSNMLDEIMSLKRAGDETRSTLDGRVTNLRAELSNAASDLALETQKTASLASTTAEVKRASEGLSRSIMDKETALSSEMRKVASLAEENTRLLGEMANLERELTASRDAVVRETDKAVVLTTSAATSKRATSKTITDLEGAINTKNAALAAEMRRATSLETSVRNLTDTKATLETEALTIDNRISSLETELATTKKSYDEEAIARRSCETASSEERERLEVIVTRLESRLKLATVKATSADAASRELEKATREIVTLNGAMEGIRKQHASQMARKDTETLDRLTAAEDMYKEAISRKSEDTDREIQTIKSKMTDLKRKFEEQLNVVELEYDESMDSELVKHKTAMTAMRNEMDRDTEALKEQHRVTMAELYTNYTNELTGGGGRQAGFMRQNRQLLKDIEDKEDEFDRTRRADESRHQEHVHELKKVIDTLKKELTRVKASRAVSGPTDELSGMLSALGAPL
jgi:hypothetical protein